MLFSDALFGPSASFAVPWGWKTVRPAESCTVVTVIRVAAASVQWPFSVGKPSPIMMRTARKELGLSAAETTIIGDTMETDILGGVQMGYRSILVLSGGTKESDLVRFAYRPDRIVPSIAEVDISTALMIS